MKKRIHVIYSGRVQGVGFRFTSESLAQSLSILGWVKNLHNGDVEIVAEGEEEVLKDFVSRLGDSFGEYIRNKEESWENPTDEFKEFGVRV